MAVVIVANAGFVLNSSSAREPLRLVRPCHAAGAIRDSDQLLTGKKDVNKNASTRD